MTVLASYGLIHIVPDKATLIQLIFLSQIGVFAHTAVGIAHRMGIFTADKRLVPMLCQEFLDIGHMGVHLAFHITGSVESSIMEKSLIMYQTGSICLVEILMHLEDGFTAKGFITAGPDNNSWMILVPLQHIGCSLEHRALPLRMTIWQSIFVREITAVFHPGAVGFQIGFIYYVKTINITQLIDKTAVRIMGTAHCIDIILLHGNNILLNQLLVTGPAAIAVKFMAVGALEHNPLAIQLHNIAIQLELTEAYILGNQLLHLACGILYHKQHSIEVWLLGTPQLDILQLCFVGAFLALHQLGLLQNYIAVAVKKLYGQLLCLRGIPFQLQGKLSKLICLGRYSMNKHILYMNLRYSVQIHAPEQTAEPPEVLILQPAATGKAEYLHRQLVFSSLYIRSQIKI